MHDTLRFWLDRGVDGFRMDVIHAIGKDPALPDDPPEVAAIPHSGAQRHAAAPTSCCAASARCSTATTATACRSARCSCSTRPRSPRTTATATSCTWRSTSRRCSRSGEAAPLGAGGSTTSPPTSSRRAGRPGCCRTTTSPATAPATAPRPGPAPRPCCCSALRGTPFLYAGEELGLEDADVPADRVVDPGGRDGCRAPIPWDASRRPRLGRRRAVAALASGPVGAATSRRCGTTRRRSSTSTGRCWPPGRRRPPSRLGDQARLDAPDGVLAWERTVGGDRRLVAVNFTERTRRRCRASPARSRSAATDAGEGEPFSGTLAPDQAVWLRP